MITTPATVLCSLFLLPPHLASLLASGWQSLGSNTKKLIYRNWLIHEKFMMFLKKQKIQIDSKAFKTLSFGDPNKIQRNKQKMITRKEKTTPVLRWQAAAKQPVSKCNLEGYGENDPEVKKQIALGTDSMNHSFCLRILWLCSLGHCSPPEGLPVLGLSSS